MLSKGKTSHPTTTSWRSRLIKWFHGYKAHVSQLLFSANFTPQKSYTLQPDIAEEKTINNISSRFYDC